MANAEIQLSNIKCIGTASCVGGLALHPALGDFPLLQWSAIDPVHPGKVMTSVGAATVEDIAIDAATTPDYEVLAGRHGTTVEHVRQAVDYAVKTGFLV